jgi:CDP-glycerol glycerophosphotransferase
MPAEPPLISVILPVYGVEAYLDDCLDSILGPADAARPDGPNGPDAELASGGRPPQTPPEKIRIEVIAVDDASPDGCGPLLDARARADPRLRVIHLAQNAGPGHARNVGLEQAAGEYVWFVDADDQVAGGALAAVTARLGRDHPDVLLIDYEDLYPDGRTAPSPGAALLRDTPPGPFTLAEQPRVIHLTMTSWSKVIRRAFLAGIGLSFPEGIHEDVALTCAMLLGAERISALAQVCYRYRRDRPGSFMAAPSDGQLRIFSSYEHVFALVDAAQPPVTEQVRAAVFERAIWHYTTVFGGRVGLVPPAARRAFFERMHEDYVRYRPAGYEPPPGAKGVKFRLVERNAYWTFTALEPVNRVRVRAARSIKG